MARHELTVRLLAAATSVAVTAVLTAALPANAAPIPYNIEVQTGSGRLDGTVTEESDAVWWDLDLEDTNKADGACVYAKIVIDRPSSSDKVFRSKDACFGEPVHFTDKDPHDHKGFTLDFCSARDDGECIRVPSSRLFSGA